MRRGRAAWAALLLTSVLSAALAAPALAEDISRERFYPLVEEAADGDPAALSVLAGVSSVEGEPFDLAAITAGATDAERSARLDELLKDRSVPDADEAALPPGIPPSPESGDEEGSGGGGLDLSLPSGVEFVGLALLAVLAALAARMIGRHQVETARDSSSLMAPPDEGPGRESLELEAERAEREGDFARALTLRFRAGLLLLDAEGAVALRPSLTPQAAAREAGSPSLARLARRYQHIVYAGDPASADDVASARTLWPQALQEARAR